MDIGTLVTIYDADDTGHRRVTDGVVSRERSAAKELDQLQKQRSSALIREWQNQNKAAESLQKQRSAAIIRQWQDEQKAAERSAKAQAKAAEDAAKSALRSQHQSNQAGRGLMGSLPGGSRASQFSSLADDLKEVAASGNIVGSVVGGLGGPLGVAAIGIGAVSLAAVGFLKVAWELSNWASEYGSNLQDLSQRTGIGVEDLSIWKAAVDTTGGSLEGVNTALGQYIRKIADANHGNKQAVADFKQIGINAKAAYESPQAAITALVNRTNQLSNEEDRLLLLRKAGVRNAEQVNAAISEMGGTYEEFRQKVASAGLIITPEQAKAADEFGDRLKYVELQLKALAFTAGSEFFPPFLQGMDALKTDLALLGPLTREWAQITAGGLGLALSMLKPYVDQVALLLHYMENIPQFQLLKALGTPAGVGLPKEFDAGNGVGVDPKTMRPFAGIGEKVGKAGGGESAARKAAQQALESARIDLREAESVYGESNAIAKRAYDTNLDDFDGFVKRRRDAEKERHQAIVNGFKAERVAASTMPTAAEQTLKLKEIGQREADELRRHNEVNAQLTSDKYIHRLDITRRFTEAEARLLEERQRTADNDLTRLINEGTKTHEQALGERFAALARVAEKQGEALRVGLVKALGDENTARALSDTLDDLISNAVNAADAQGLADSYNAILGKAVNQEATKEALNAVVEFFLKRKQAFQQNNQDTRDAQAEDLQNWQGYAQRLADIQSSILESQFTVRQMGIDAGANNNFRRGATIEAQRALDVAREMARSTAALMNLNAGRDRVPQTEQNERRRAQLIAQIDRQIEAETRQSAARILEIDRQAAEERRQQLADVANDIAGILTSGLEQFDGTWSSVWRGMLDEALSVIRQIASELMKLSFESLLTGKTNGSSAGGIVGFLTNALGGALLGGFGGGLPSAGGPSNMNGSYLQPGTLRFATGGSFIVGGPAGIDKTPVNFMASRGERVTIETPGQQARTRGGDTYYVTLPPVREKSYVQPRSRRELADAFTAALGQRR